MRIGSDQRDQHDRAQAQHQEARLGDRRGELRARGHPDLREEEREPEVAQHEVGRKRDGPVHAARAAHVAEDQRHDQHAGQADRDLADAGQRELDGADQEAERHAEADGDVAELGGGLDRVAEEFAHRREIAAMGEHADAVAGLEHEVGARQDVGVAAADLGDDRRPVARQVEVADRAARPPPAARRTRAGSRGPAVLDKRPGAASPRALPACSSASLVGATASTTSFSATT